MKKIIICFTALLAVIISCRKTNYSSEEKSSPKVINQSSRLQTENDFESKRQMFVLMTPSERFNLWKRHLENAKDQFTRSNERPKVNLINELLSGISVSVFDENSTPFNVFTNYFFPMWQSRAQSVFSTIEMYDLTFDPTEDNIGSRTAPPEIGTTPGGGSAPGCWCHGGQSGYSCVRLKFPWGFETGVCERVGDCIEKKPGCGTLWLFSCDGNHCNFG